MYSPIVSICFHRKLCRYFLLLIAFSLIFLSTKMASWTPLFDFYSLILVNKFVTAIIRVIPCSFEQSFGYSFLKIGITIRILQSFGILPFSSPHWGYPCLIPLLPTSLIGNGLALFGHYFFNRFFYFFVIYSFCSYPISCFPYIGHLGFFTYWFVRSSSSSSYLKYSRHCSMILSSAENIFLAMFYNFQYVRFFYFSFSALFRKITKHLFHYKHY